MTPFVCWGNLGPCISWRYFPRYYPVFYYVYLSRYQCVTGREVNSHVILCSVLSVWWFSFLIGVFIHLQQSVPAEL